jgi:hypothetical protein
MAPGGIEATCYSTFSSAEVGTGVGTARAQSLDLNPSTRLFEANLDLHGSRLVKPVSDCLRGDITARSMALPAAMPE